MSFETTVDNAIVVDGVSKCFRMRGRGGRSLKSAVLDLFHRNSRGKQTFWALRDLSFSVPPGETLGIIGVNGAGKSTLLSLLAGTKQPTSGRIQTTGSISSLLELGAGFHPELTGRENVFLAGAVMGIPRRVMRERFQDIVNFSGIETFIDQPVKQYSSGMYVRLGFAVAVEVDPDILLIDEVLAVGDTAFQRKCMARISDFRRRGKTMLIISHDIATVQAISDRILLLDDGQLLGLGSPDDMVARYRGGVPSQRRRTEGREWGSGEVTLDEISFLDADGKPCRRVRFGDTVHIQIRYTAHTAVPEPVFGFSIGDEGGTRIYGNNTQIEGYSIPTLNGAGTLRLALGPLTMAPGTYLFSFSVHSADHRIQFHRRDNAFSLAVEGVCGFEGCYMPVIWEGPLGR